MTHDTQMHLLLLSELVFAQRAKDPETFKRWFAAGSRITTSTTLQREQLMHSQLVEENSKEGLDRMDLGSIRPWLTSDSQYELKRDIYHQLTSHTGRKMNKQNCVFCWQAYDSFAIYYSVLSIQEGKILERVSESIDFIRASPLLVDWLWIRRNNYAIKDIDERTKARISQCYNRVKMR